MINELKEQFLAHLFRIEAIRFGDFRLKLHERHPEAPFSPIYFDLRLCRRLPNIRRDACSLLESKAQSLTYDLVADVPTAGTVFTSSLADRTQKGMISPRLKKKEYGSGSPIDGMFEDDLGKRVLLIDDLISDGQSKIEAIKLLREYDYVVNDVLVLIDRQQGGTKRLSQHNCTLHSIYTFDEIMKHCMKGQLLSRDQTLRIKKTLRELDDFAQLPAEI